jgi:hypothetical protein
VQARDLDVWDGLLEVIDTHGHSHQHLLEQFPSYVRRIHLARFLAHYEIFKHVVDLPGCVVDLGVHRGKSLFTWAKLMETFCPGDRRRHVYGFDWFEGLTDFDDKDGAKQADSAKVEGGLKEPGLRDEIVDLVRIHNQDGFIPTSPRTFLVEGDVRETLPAFLEAHPGLRISLLHFDMDLYKPTRTALELLYPRVVSGGAVVFDEYGLIPWEGESRAVDEYFAEQGLSPRIQKFPFSTTPHGWFLKP